MYGPYFPLHCSKYMKIRTLPKLISERTEMFRYFSCKFRVEKYKENCARLAIWRDFNVTYTFTVETSQFGFLNAERETVRFNTGLLQEFGECMIHSIFEYNLIQEEDRRMKLALAKRLKADRKKRRQTIAEILSGGPHQKSLQHHNKSRSMLLRGQNPMKGKSDSGEDPLLENEQQDDLINNIEFDEGPARVTSFNENPNEAAVGNPQQDMDEELVNHQTLNQAAGGTGENKGTQNLQRP